MSKQKGFYTDGMATVFTALMIVSAVVGWGVIEGILWIIAHISIGWVG